MNLADQVAAITAQRDELLQVLVDIAAHTDGYDGILEWACRKSLSAIIKCRDECEVALTVEDNGLQE